MCLYFDLKRKNPIKGITIIDIMTAIPWSIKFVINIPKKAIITANKIPDMIFKTFFNFDFSNVG